MAHEQANADFDRAMTKAFLRNVVSVIRRQPNTLLPYHQVRERVMVDSESYRGMRTVPISQIVGSFDRYRDFDRAFLPRVRSSAQRWKSVDRAFLQDIQLPPIQVYKVGEVYFVKDGHHRVSVARERGAEFIDAEVIEGHLRAPLHSSMSPREILRQLEYAEFLRRTDLDRSRPDHDIRPTALGRYDELLGLIADHAREMEERRGLTVALPEAAVDWYETIYLPITLAAREQDVLREFPDRTETDIFLWVMIHLDEIRNDDQIIDPHRSTQVYRRQEKNRRYVQRKARRLVRWLGSRLSAVRARA